MKHKLLPVMIGAIVAGGMTAAQADITVFGHLDTSIVSWEDDVDGSARMDYRGDSEYETDSSKWSEDDVNFVCTTCSIGFKGSEDLGNGLAAIFKLDYQFNIFSRDKTSFTDRDQWLGLKGNFGQVRWGSISTSYKSHGAMIDPVYRTVAQARDLGLQSALHRGAGEEGQGRAEHTIRWDSPSWNGVKVTAHYTLDSDQEMKSEDNDPYGIGAQYSNGGILVFADYLTNAGDGDVDQNELTAWKLGGKYTINNFSFYGQYEDIQDDWSTTDGGAATSNGVQDVVDHWNELWVHASDYHFDADEESTVWFLGGSYAMGNNAIHVAYGMAEHDYDGVGDGAGHSAEFDVDSLSIVGTHALSKRTTVYAAYLLREVDGDASLTDEEYTEKASGSADFDAFALGLKHKF